MTLGERILKYRKKAGISQEELADRLNVTRQSISLWETDQTLPSLDNLIALADIFGISMDELCGRDVDEKTAKKATYETKTATSETNVAEKSEEEACFACAKTILTPSILKDIQKITQRKSFVSYVVTIVLCAFAIISAIINSRTEGIDDGGAVIISFFGLSLIVIAILLVKLIVTGKAQYKKNLEEYKNFEYRYLFYDDYMIVKTQSDTTNSAFRVKYDDIKRTVADSKIIYVVCDSILPIDKSSIGGSLNVVLGVLQSRENPSLSTAPTATDKRPSVNKSSAIKTLLLVTFILSIASIPIALIIVAISVQTSPIPEFGFAMVEHMWKFFLLIPIPLTSAILGIVFRIKKYKCKKNIIAGFIMCALLAIYGSFTFAFKDQIGHDFEYVNNLEYTVGINLPNSGNVSYQLKGNANTKSNAMIKFDNANEIRYIVSNNQHFKRDTNYIPSNLVKAYDIATTANYDYFLLYDVTCGEFNNASSGNHDGHNFIYLAYSVNSNILYVLDFEK